LWRPSAPDIGRLFADTYMDAKVQEVGLAVRRRVGYHCRAHADASIHSLRVAGGIGPTCKCTHRACAYTAAAGWLAIRAHLSYLSSRYKKLIFEML